MNLFARACLVSSASVFISSVAFALPTKSIKLTVSNYTGTETLSSFPVAVRLSSATPGFDYAKCQAGGADVSFKLEDGTVLNREIESWNPDGESIVWVSLPVLKPNAVFYLWYADSAQTTQPASQDDGSVWSAAGYKMVLHFAPGDRFLRDSTCASGVTVAGYGATEVSGVLGGGVSLPGGACNVSSVEVSPTHVNTMSVKSKMTASFRLCRPSNAISHGSRVFCGNNSASGAAFDIMQWSSGSQKGLCLRGSGSGNGVVNLPTDALDWSAWNQFNAVFDGTSVQVYTNGFAASMASSTITAISGYTNPIRVGSYGGGSGIKGSFDECRIRDGVSSAEWILAEQQTASTDFLTFEPVVAAEDTLTVVGLPANYGTPNPNWGENKGYSIGTRYTCTIPAACTNDATGVIAYPASWRLTDADDQELDAGLGMSCSFDYAGATMLYWTFGSYAYRVRASADVGGTVDKPVSWVPAGESVTLTAVPSSGFELHHWTVDGALMTGNPLVVTPTAAAEVQAVFAERIDLTPESAMSVNEAVDHLAGRPGVIRLAAGIYPLVRAVTNVSEVSIVGAGRDTTVLQAASGHRALVLGHAKAVVCGVTLRGAGVKPADIGDKGGAVWILPAGGRIEDCRITNGRFESYSLGSGVYMEGGQLVRTLVDGNRIASGASSSGGGIYMTGGLVDTCLITNNMSRAIGGGVAMTGGKIVGSTIAGNQVTYGGTGCGAGLSMDSTVAGEHVIGCVIYGNEATAGVISGEADPNWHCAAAYRSSFVNCATPAEVGSGHQVVGADDFTDGWRLTGGSKCIDHGATCAEAVSQTDFDGAARVSGAAVDIGCFEYVTAGVECDAVLSTNELFVGEQVSFAATLRGFEDGEQVDYAWSVTCGDETVFTSTQANPSLTTDRIGTHVVTLTVTSRDNPTRTADATPKSFRVAARRIDLQPGDDIAAAVATAITGTKVYLAAGEYVLSNEVVMTDGVEIRGAGRAVTRVRRDPSVGELRIFRLDHASARLEGVTVANGYCYASSGIEKGGVGVGVLIDLNGGTVVDCCLTNCSPSVFSGYGALACLSPAGRIDRCLFVDNCGHIRGGGACLARGTCRNSLFVGNTASVGGGLCVLRLASIEPTDVVVENCTFTGNNAYGTYPNSGGVGTDDGAVFTLRNGILIGNTADNFVEEEPHVDWRGEGITFVNCLFADEGAAAGTSPVWGTPAEVFRNPARGDFRLRTGSPAIDAGVTLAEMTAMTDLKGNPRVVNKRVDIGCYEATQSGLMLLVR